MCFMYVGIKSLGSCCCRQKQGVARYLRYLDLGRPLGLDTERVVYLWDTFSPGEQECR